MPWTPCGPPPRPAVAGCLAAWLAAGPDPCISSEAGLLSLSTSDNRGQTLLRWGWGAVLCVIGCLAASLVSTHEMPVVTFAPYSKDCQWHLSLNSDNQRCLQTSPYVPWTQNPQLRTSELLGMF